MSIAYAQKNKNAVQTKRESSVSIIDSSSQSESLQRKANMANNAAQREESPRPNNTGMPNNLKSGIESLSGFSMDDVRVHYNSSKPATVQALAYTQGTDIHVAPGQEKHLPHEAWHVAQQMAGRVSPTTNINGMPVNDNAALEHEADVMGEKAVQCKAFGIEKKNKRIDSSCCQMAKTIQELQYDNSVIELLYSVNQFIMNHEFNNEDDKNAAKKIKGESALYIRKWNDFCLKHDSEVAYYISDIKNMLSFVKRMNVGGYLLDYHKADEVISDLLFLKNELKERVRNFEITCGIKEENDTHFDIVCANAMEMCDRVKDKYIKAYFGKKNKGLVKQKYSEIKNGLNKIQKNRLYVNNYTAESNVEAYVYKDEDPEHNKHAGKIRLTRLYRLANEKGKNSKAGMLIHEASHLELKTNDLAYGPAECKKLRKKSPSETVDNADSYAMAAESISPPWFV